MVSDLPAGSGRSAAATLYDVAREAGVPTATVSRVVHGQDRVRPATRRRVLAVIEALGHAPDGAAQSLATQRKDNRAGTKAAVRHLIERHRSTRLFNLSGRPQAADARERRSAFDEALAEFPLLAPALTTVRRPMRLLGERGCARLLQRIAERALPPRCERLPTELVIRESCCCRADVFVDGRYISKDTWYDADGQPFQPQVHYFVGGATKMYGAALYRLRPADFGEIQHADGLSPAWPLTYKDFEPWYTKAEWLYQVHGAHGQDPTEGHWSRQYPWPAVSHEPRIQQISDALRDAGYHPFAAPCGILLNEADRPASACIRCATCDGYPCLVHAKSDADIIAVRPVLDRDNVTLLTGAEVQRLETDEAGRTVTGVVVSRAGQTETFSGDIVVVSAGAANSARILLRSASDQHPAGLANGSGLVGRNYMFHNSNAVVAIDTEPNDTMFQKTLGLNDFYFAGPGRPWPLGNIQMVGKSNAAAMKGEEPKLTRLAPRLSLEEVAHQAGTCKFGSDQASSVLDLNCKAHELDNLYVVDTSFFPRIGAVNPALTVMANALRVADHPLDRTA